MKEIDPTVIYLDNLSVASKYSHWGSRSLPFNLKSEDLHSTAFIVRQKIIANILVTGLAHGYLAAIAVRSRITSYVTCLRGLAATPSNWIPTLYPATAFLKLQNTVEQDLYPQKVPVCPSDMVRLNGKAYQKLVAKQQYVSNSKKTSSEPESTINLRRV